MNLYSRAAAAGLALAFMFGGVASAAEIFIKNADFETDGLADGEIYGSHVNGPDGWSASGGSSTGQWNPTADNFSDHAAHGTVAFARGEMQAQGSAGMLGQTLDGVTLQANTRYTLTLDVGGRMDVGSSGWGYDFGLIGGNLGPDAAILASMSGFIDPATGQAIPLGTMRTISLIFETGATGDYLGQALTIGLAGMGRGAAYDNIRLDAMALTPSAVPEPAAWAMMILGLGGVGAVARSRRKAGLRLA